METTLFLKNRLVRLTQSRSIQPLFVRLMVAVLLLLVWLPSGKLDGADRDEARSDVLTFHGGEKVPSDSLSADSVLVVLDCKTAVPQKYSFILRGIDPVEKALLQDIQSGKWAEHFGLFRSAMIIEGIRDPSRIKAYEARLDALVAKVVSAQQASGNTSQQALTRALFEAMHKEILTQPYSLDCTELSKVMSTGRFNCVSATVLFNCLAEKAGLNVCALEMPGHALSRVKFADGTVMNLETTCATWFDLQSDKDRQMATLRRVAPSLAQPNPPTGNSAGAPSTTPQKTAAELPLPLREITPVQLLATIYYNIGVDLLTTSQQHPEAAAANIKALYLDKDNGQAWANLCAAVNNWALELTQKKKRYDIATVLLEQGTAIDPMYEDGKFRHNQVYVFHEWIKGLALQGHFDLAREVFAYADQRIPGDERLLRLIGDVNEEEKKVKQRRK